MTRSTNAKASYQFLEACLRHKSELVIYEAAKAMCQLPGVDRNDLSPAITVLQLFLSSPKPALRFAAMRTLSEVAVAHPLSAAKCNDDMESLVCMYVCMSGHLYFIQNLLPLKLPHPSP